MSTNICMLWVCWHSISASHNNNNMQQLSISHDPAFTIDYSKQAATERSVKTTHMHVRQPQQTTTVSDNTSTTVAHSVHIYTHINWSTLIHTHTQRDTILSTTRPSLLANSPQITRHSSWLPSEFLLMSTSCFYVYMYVQFPITETGHVCGFQVML